MPRLDELLLEFEKGHREGTPMVAARLAALEEAICTLLYDEFSLHENDLPVRDSKTQRVKWTAESKLKLSDEQRQRWTNCRDAGDWLSNLLLSLDRLLRQGTRRRAGVGGGFAPPRIAEQVARAVRAGQLIDDAEQLVRDCLKHAIYDELRSIVRRTQSDKPPRQRATTVPRLRGRDGRMLVRRLSPSRLMQAAAGLEETLALCLAYEYQAGGHDRVVFVPFEQLALGAATLAAFLDLVDAAFKADDETLAQQSPGSTRRKPARQRGLGADTFAGLLGVLGIDRKASSLPKLYSRHAQEILRRARGQP